MSFGPCLGKRESTLGMAGSPDKVTSGTVALRARFSQPQ